MLDYFEARFNKRNRIGCEKLQQLGGSLAVEVEIAGAHVATKFLVGESLVEPAKRSP